MLYENQCYMLNFIHIGKPNSYNSNTGNKKIRYKADIENSLRQYHPSCTIQNGEVYASIFYFFNKDKNLDTDNISKPIIDSLCGVLFNDDKQVKIRTAGSFNLSVGDFNLIDFSGLDGQLVADLVDAFFNEDHIIYIECGTFNHSMFNFNIENRWNSKKNTSVDTSIVSQWINCMMNIPKKVIQYIKKKK